MDSFLNSSLGVDTSATNYTKTAPDLTKSVNEQIDENVKMMNNHFDSLIKMQQQSRKARKEGWVELTKFTKEGLKFAAWARDKADAKNAINNYYDRSLNKVKSRAKREAELDINEAELDAQKRVNYTAAGEIEAFDPELSSALKETGRNRAQTKELLSLAVGQSGEFFERAKSQIQAEVAPGVWKSWDEPGGLTALERSIISKEIDEVFITQLVNSGINNRLIEKYVLKPMLKQHDARLVTAQAESLKAEKEQDIAFRNKEFADNFNLLAEASNGGGGEAIEKYLQDYNGYHSTSSGLKDKGYFLAKQELQGFILAGVQKGLIDPNDADAALGYELSPNDGGKPRSVEEYLPQFAAPIRKAITKARSDKYEQAKLELQNRQNAWVQPVLEEWRKNPPTEEVVQEMNQEYRAEFGENHSDLLNFWSKQDIADKDITLELEERWRNGEEIRLEDLDGITDVVTKQQWMQKVNSGGMSQTDTSRRDRFIKGLTLERLWDENADKTTSNPMYSAIMDQATDYYTAIYRQERTQGQTHETALGLARQQTEDAINKGSFDTRPLYTRDEVRADNINSAREAIIKDNSVIDSSSFWPGEEPELKAALKYIKNGTGYIPEYYRSFPNINLTAHELMQRRLAATGMLKSSEVEPIPERKLEPVQQDLLLNKTSPARTNRALLDPYGVENIEELVELTGADSVEQLLEILRQNAERNNRLSGYEISQVNIDPTLEEEHTQVVGEQPPFMRLNTLLPGVATAYVEDTYNV